MLCIIFNNEHDACIIVFLLLFTSYILFIRYIIYTVNYKLENYQQVYYVASVKNKIHGYNE